MPTDTILGRDFGRLTMFKKIILILSVIFLSGCETIHYNLSPGYTFDKASSNNIVFGEVKFTNFGNEMNGAVSLKLLRLEDNKVFDLHSASSGFVEHVKLLNNKGLSQFYFEIPPGTYKINYIERGNWKINLEGIRFKILGPGKIFYIGQLEFIAKKKPGLFSFNIPFDMRVVNNYEENKEAFKERFAYIDEEINIQLIEISNKK